MASLIFLVLLTTMACVTAITFSHCQFANRNGFSLAFAMPKLVAVPIPGHPGRRRAPAWLGLRADFVGCRHAELWAPRL